MLDSERHADAIRDQLELAVRDAGRLALPKFRTEVKNWTKDQSSPVTEVDIAVDEFLHDRLGGIAPDYGWLSEETADNADRLASRRVWIVDPIDGTRGFMAGFPDWTIVAALVEDGRPIAAALFAPVTDEMFTASRGAGAWLNGKAIAASPGERVGGIRMAGPKSYLTRVAALAGDTVALPKVHSLALRLARVAHGAVDVAFASANSRDWDLAAADLLVHEAGGVVTDFDGRPLQYNRPDPVHGALIASGRDRHAALLDLMGDRKSGFA